MEDFANFEENMAAMDMPPTTQADDPTMFATDESNPPPFNSNFIEEDMISESLSKENGFGNIQDLSAVEEEKKEDEPEEVQEEPRKQEAEQVEQDNDDDNEDDEEEEEEDEEEETQYTSKRRKEKRRSRRNRSKKPMPEDATPQELYAIGAVFEHLYRGGSPSKCIRVYQKEMSRAPELSMFGRSAYRGEDDEWTYNDMDTIDDNGTSYMSVDETIFSSSTRTRRKPEQPWDEATAVKTATARIGPFLKNAKNGAKAKLDLGTKMWSEMAGIATTTNEEPTKETEEENEPSEEPTTPVIEEKETSPDDEKSTGAILAEESNQTDKKADMEASLNDILGDREDEEAEEVQLSSDLFKPSTEEAAAVAKEDEEPVEKVDPEPVQENDQEDEESKGPGPAVTMEDVKALVGMFRKTIAERLPEDNKSLQTALARVFSCNGRSEDVADTVQELQNAVEMEDPSNEQRPLNHLAKKMQSIAMKEPTQTFAISEQDQIVKKEASSLQENLPSEEALQRQQSEEKAVLSLPSEQNSIVGGNASLSGISKADSAVGSHRGEVASASSQPKPNVPTSIQMHTIQKESADTSSYSESSEKAQITFVGVNDSPAEQKLPPIPPTKSPAPLSTVCVSSDMDATEMGVIDSFEVRIGTEKDTITPPRPTKKKSSSSKFLGGISIKKRFSLRKQKGSKKDTPKKEESPRSTMMVDNHAFSKNLNDSADACIALADALVDESVDDNDSHIVKQLNFEDENATTSGVLLTQTNDFAYEVESV